VVEQVGVLNLVAHRWVPFRHSLSVVGISMLDPVYAMQVRTTPDAAGPPILSLTTALSPAQGVSTEYVGSDTIANHIAAGRLDAVPEGYTADQTVTLSVVEIRIDEATMEAFPFPAERGDDLVLAWDLHVTLGAGIKEKWLEGQFIVHAGATQ
jgi:hypothetical protein